MAKSSKLFCQNAPRLLKVDNRCYKMLVSNIRERVVAKPKLSIVTLICYGSSTVAVYSSLGI